MSLWVLLQIYPIYLKTILNNQVVRDLVTPSTGPCGYNLSRVLPGSLRSYAIHSWIIRPCPGMSHARLASSRLSWPFCLFPPSSKRFWPPPWWIFLPQANSLVFEFTFERSPGFAGGCSCSGVTYIFTTLRHPKPKFLLLSAFYSSALWATSTFSAFCCLSILCVQLLLSFVG